MKRPKKLIGLVAHDMAPCLAFGLLAVALVKKGFGVIPVLLKAGQKSAPDNWDELLACDSVVIGMSSSPELAQAETSVANWAKEKKVPFFFYADTFGVYGREWFAPFRGLASGIFVLDYPEEIQAARELFPNALIIPAGNPTHLAYFSHPITRKEIRRRIGFGTDDFVILVSLCKSQALNFELLKAVRLGVCMTRNRRRTKVVFSLHPGDKTWPGGYKKLIEALTCPIITFSFLTQGQATPSELLCGADLVIGSSPSIDTEAACKKVPSIFFLSEGVCERLQLEVGQPDWPPCRWGASLPAKEWQDITRYLSDSGKSFKALLAHQEEVYPAPSTEGGNQSLDLMIEAIARL